MHGSSRYQQFKTDDNNASINDWGSAVHKKRPSQKYNGVMAEASPAILDAFLNNREPSPKYNNDLHALARTLFCILHSPSSDILPPTFILHGLIACTILCM